ncbi:alpha/beta fold hydrolase [Pseudoduganella sp. FT93W]|uniref:Alpha/beta fold hydrolase n=1 Tax=Duganella fentianensis TaxID=2692177 RepID=A0A845HYJ8_9BURK|nr:alpha/beta hydrolase [Duganella fentianensis]MYN45962.1 alpha/beta fold hydrolase [Duganella fentianensis]
MLFDVQGQSAYCYTGGKLLDTSLPAIVFIHGAQNDHSVWALQSRYFAHHGYAVLAVDLPGHGRSSGPALASVPAMAQWLLALLDAAGIQQAALCGHSMGSLIALEASHQAPARVSRLALLGSTYPMKVSPALLDMARKDEASAIDMVNIYSHASLTGRSAIPGMYTPGVAQKLMQRLSQGNPAQLFYTDFTACNEYANGEQAAGAVQCPTLFVCGTRDMMTPIRSARPLVARIPHAQTTMIDSGHSLMNEQPAAVLDALRDWLDRTVAPTQQA